MKKGFMNFMAFIGIVTVIVALAAGILYVKGRVQAKYETRKSNEYIYTQIDNFMERNNADKSITLERQSNGDIKVIHNNGYKVTKYDFVWARDGSVTEIEN